MIRIEPKTSSAHYSHSLRSLGAVQSLEILASANDFSAAR
jgi:hypothetical protein